jgi:hypothetical protein
MRVKTKKKKITNNSKKMIKGSDPKLESLMGKVNQLRVLSSVSRLNLGAGGLQGQGFNGDRDLYNSVGWIENPTMSTYISYYERSIGKAVVNKKPDYTWNGAIKLKSPDKDSKLPEAWRKLEQEFGLTDIFNKADKLAGILQYSVIMLGLSDENADKPEMDVVGFDIEGEPINRDLQLNFVKVFRQDHATVQKIHGNVGSPLFGKPAIYSIDVINSSTTNQGLQPGSSAAGATNPTIISPVDPDGKPVTNNVKVSSTRVIHVAENLLEGDIYGTPRQEACLNNIQDLEKVHGGSAEMFWRGALPGWAFSIDADAEYDEDDINSMDQEIDNMLLGLQRSLKLQGITPTSLAPQVSDPRPHSDVQLKTISAITNIPMRILIGSESGELASSEDADNWDSEIKSRRDTDCERWLRDFINKCMAFGILPQEVEYQIIWPPVNAQNEELRAKVALNLSLALKNYTTSINPEGVIPINTFLTEIMGFSEQLANDIEGVLDVEDERSDTFADIDKEILRDAQEKMRATEDAPTNEPEPEEADQETA